MDIRKSINIVGNYISTLGVTSSVKLVAYKMLLLALNPGKMRREINKRKHALVYSYINDNYTIRPVDDKYESETKPRIWVFWWQGIENAPKIVKLTINSIYKYAGDMEVVLLTEENYTEYVIVPDVVLTKVAKGMSYAHLSDYIRLDILYRYGGLWLDSTILLTAPLTKEIFNADFYSIHIKPKDNDCVAEYRYFVSVMACKPGNSLIYNVRNIFHDYWQKHDYAIDYLFMDYLIDFVARNVEANAQMLTSIPFNNPNVTLLNDVLDKKYDEELFNNIKKDTTIFKINFKTPHLSDNNTILNNLYNIYGIR